MDGFRKIFDFLFLIIFDSESLSKTPFFLHFYQLGLVLLEFDYLEVLFYIYLFEFFCKFVIVLCLSVMSIFLFLINHHCQYIRKPQPKHNQSNVVSYLFLFCTNNFITLKVCSLLKVSRKFFREISIE